MTKNQRDNTARFIAVITLLAEILRRRKSHHAMLMIFLGTCLAVFACLTVVVSLVIHFAWLIAISAGAYLGYVSYRRHNTARYALRNATRITSAVVSPDTGEWDTRGTQADLPQPTDVSRAEQVREKLISDPASGVKPLVTEWDGR